MKFILGTKEYMTQVFDEKGRVFPGTVISAGPVVVIQIKNKDTDGYQAIRVGFKGTKANRLNKPILGQLKGKGPFKFLKEFRFEGDVNFKVGDTIDLSAFAPGDIVVVTSTSKGKGFQGVVKRHGFSGGARTHGQKHSEREAGSIGGGLRTRVPKGMRMPGRMGGEKVSIKNLKIISVSPEQNELIVSGAVPGRRGTLVEVRGI